MHAVLSRIRTVSASNGAPITWNRVDVAGKPAESLVETSFVRSSAYVVSLAGVSDASVVTHAEVTASVVNHALYGVPCLYFDIAGRAGDSDGVALPHDAVLRWLGGNAAAAAGDTAFALSAPVAASMPSREAVEDDEYADMATYGGSDGSTSRSGTTAPSSSPPPAVMATLEMHPHLRRMCWCLHPCGMPTILTDMGATAAPSDDSRLLAWASVQLPLVGITVLPPPASPP